MVSNTKICVGFFVLGIMLTITIGCLILTPRRDFVYILDKNNGRIFDFKRTQKSEFTMVIGYGDDKTRTIGRIPNDKLEGTFFITCSSEKEALVICNKIREQIYGKGNTERNSD